MGTSIMTSVRTTTPNRVDRPSSTYQGIDLLLIPAETVPANAERALTMATDGHDLEITPPDGRHPALARSSNKQHSPGRSDA
jgi:hypothetical protein